MRLRIHGRRFELYFRLGSPPHPSKEMRLSWLINGTHIPDFILNDVPLEMHALLQHRVRETIRAGYEHDPTLDGNNIADLWARVCTEMNWQLRTEQVQRDTYPSVAHHLIRVRNSLATQNFDIPWRSRAGGRSLPVVCLDDVVTHDQRLIITPSDA